MVFPLGGPKGVCVYVCVCVWWGGGVEGSIKLFASFVKKGI